MCTGSTQQQQPEKQPKPQARPAPAPPAPKAEEPTSDAAGLKTDTTSSRVAAQRGTSKLKIDLNLPGALSDTENINRRSGLAVPRG